LRFASLIAVSKTDKYILQLLIDYEHDYKKGQKVVDFKTGESYVYE